MTTAAERARAWRERTHRELADDVATLLQNSHEAAVFRALAGLPGSALRSLRDSLSDAPGAGRSLYDEREAG